MDNKIKIASTNVRLVYRFNPAALPNQETSWHDADGNGFDIRRIPDTQEDIDKALVDGWTLTPEIPAALPGDAPTNAKGAKAEKR